jgi:hypothetical protein
MALQRNLQFGGPMRQTAVLIFAFLAGCAASPQPPAATATAIAPAPKAAAPVTPPPAATTAAVDPKVLAKARALGFRPRVFNGQTKFCKDEPQLGSRFSTTTCVSTEEQLDQLARSAEETRQRMLHGHGCAGSSAGGSCADGG